MIAKIQRNQIRYYKSQTEDKLQLGIQFTEYPDLPTYGINVDVTGLTTQAQLRAAIVTEIKALQTKVESQIADNEEARQYFDTWGWSGVEFEVDSL